MESGDFYSRKVDLAAGFRVQIGVIGALILRESRTRFGEHRLGYIWAVVEPSMHIGVWFTYLAMIRPPEMYGMNTVLFLATGIIPMFLFRRTHEFIWKAISSNRPLLQYPLVKHPDLIIARFVLEGMTMFAVSVLILGFLVEIGIIPPPYDVMSLISVSAALLMLGFGFGGFNAVASVLSPTFDRILGLSGRIIYFSSGIFFKLETIPPKYLHILSYSPVCQGLSLFRAAYIHGYRIPFVASVWYIHLWGLTFLFFGLTMERAYRINLQVEK